MVRTIVGDGSPLQLHTPVQYQDVSLQQDAKLANNIPDGFQGLLYVVEGKLNVNEQTLPAGSAVFFDDTDKVLSVYAQRASHYMLCLGQPHKEPIKQWGPFVD